jgi:homoserine O-succinyltransferase
VSTELRADVQGPYPAASRIALVNNMPDAAFDATERQFVDLVRSASGPEIDIKLYTLPGIERGAVTRASLNERYLRLDDLWDDPPDALIVTGTEPLAADLTTEPYWESLARLITWAEDATFSTMLSCLAAHAALLIFDGIEREPLPQKCSGVFNNEVRHPHPLVKGLGGRAAVPHSRLNDVPAERLRATGYTTLLQSCDAGWTIAAKRRGRSLFVLCQGHLEYGADTLLREYRRDVRRFLGGERPTYPQLPVGYIDADGAERLATFRADTAEGTLRTEGAFPYAQIAAGLEKRWEQTARTFSRNWVRYVAREARHARTRERIRS